MRTPYLRPTHPAGRRGGGPATPAAGHQVPPPARSPRRRLVPLLLAILSVVGSFALPDAGAAREPSGALPAAASRPNIVFILTDDQTKADLAYMLKVNQLLGN